VGAFSILAAQVAPGRFNALWGSSPRPLTSLRGESGGTSGWIHDLGYLCSAFRRGRLIPNELSLQLSTFLRSLDLFLELRARTFLRSRLTTNQPRCGGKQGTDGIQLPPTSFPLCRRSTFNSFLLVRDLIHERNYTALQGGPQSHERLCQAKAV
jgi:hypothetical protein